MAFNAANELTSGAQVGDFVIERQIGVGGMGVVYLAEDTRLRRRVALKLIAPQLAADTDFRQRFEEEARNAARVDHPNAIPVYSAGAADEHLFIAMRFIDGQDLRALLREGGHIEPDIAARVVEQVAAALDAAHRAGLVHRDVKPANILLEGQPDSATCFLGDFGLTKGLEESNSGLTQTGHWVGTLDYVAPEQMTGEPVSAKTDVYSLGCVLYEMLTGEVPFKGANVKKVWAHIHEEPPSLIGTAADESARLFDPIIHRAMAKAPDDRFASAGDLARAATAATQDTKAELTEQPVAKGAALQPTEGASQVGDEGPTRRMPIPGRRSAEATTPQPRRDRGGGSRTAAILGAALVLGAALIGGALVIAGAVSDEGETGGSTTTRSGIGGGIAATTPATQEESVADTPPADSSPTPSDDSTAPTRDNGFISLPLQTYDQMHYTAMLPADWRQKVSDARSDNHFSSTWRDPQNDNTSITIDVVPGQTNSASEAAAENVQDLRDSGSYEEIALHPTRINGLEATRWIFDLPEEGDRRVDYFFNIGDLGFAVLGSTDTELLDALEPLVRKVAESIVAAN